MRSDERPATMRIRAYGRSMWPLVPPGTELEVEPLGERRPEPGEIAVGVRAGRLIAHRVVRVERNGGVVTRGDAHSVEDPAWRPGDLVGTVTAAVVGGLRVPLDGAAARLLGRFVVERREWFDASAAFARRAARAARAAATIAVFSALRVRIARVRVRDLGVADERDVDRLLMLAGRDASAAGSVPLRDALERRACVGAFVAGSLVGVVLPCEAVGGGTPGDFVLVVRPAVRGSVERPLLEAARDRGIGEADTLERIPSWRRGLYRALGIDVREAPGGACRLRA